MVYSYSGPIIPQDLAWELCMEIRTENRRAWYRAAAWQCWGCTRFSGGNPEQMCVSNRPDYRGCRLVNARFDRLPADGSERVEATGAA